MPFYNVKSTDCIFNIACEMKYINTVLISLGVTILGILLYHNTVTTEVKVQEESKIEQSSPAPYFQEVNQPLLIKSGNTNLVKAAAKSIPAVVYVRSITGVERDKWQTSYTSNSGSGVLISEDGFIITNRHLIASGDKIEIILNDRREYEAEIIGTDRSTDLALLKIEATDLPVLEFANSSKLKVGEWVIAVGNPFKLHSTVTAGIISAIARDIPFSGSDEIINSFIQTDAVVNKGNSGGALVDEEGYLIGINSAILTQSGRFEGYSFAIPSNLVLKVIEDLRQYGAVHRGELGIKGISINAELAQAKKLPAINGVYVDQTTHRGAADKAGIKSGDIITRLNSSEIHTLPQLYQKLATFRPGDVIQIQIYRNQQYKDLEVRLKNKTHTEDITTATRSTTLKDEGFELRNLSTAETENIGINGVKVLSVISGSAIARTKLEPGFIITHVNNEPVTNIQELQILLNSMDGRIILEGIYEKYEGEFWYVFSK